MATTDTTRTNTANFKCPNCGGNALFDPSISELRCPLCDTIIPIERTTLNNVELDYVSALKETTKWTDDLRVFHCNNCGAETILQGQTVADFCSFCGSSHIEKTEDNAGIRPALLIPFHIAREEAERMFKDWIKKRYLAPNKLKSAHTLDRLTGIYIPYWTYDTTTSSHYTVRIGTHYYVPETYTTTDANGNTTTHTRMVQHTRWHTENGYHEEFFDDVLIHATNKNTDHLLRKIEPFRLHDLVDYQDAYLSGFIAERYAVPIEAGWRQAQKAIDAGIEASIQGKTRGDVVIVQQVDTDYEAITYKHILLPIWLSSFQFNDKVYPFIVNGQSGKVAGDAPTSWVKVSLLVFIGLIVIAFMYFYFTGSSMDTEFY